MKKIYITRSDLFRGIPMILCNKITEADPDFVENNIELLEYECEECKGAGTLLDSKDNETECTECNGEGKHTCEPYQYFIVAVNDLDIEHLKEYGVELGYSSLLDLHVLPIYDYGTSWSHFSYSREVPDNYEIQPYSKETLTRTTVY